MIHGGVFNFQSIASSHSRRLMMSRRLCFRNAYIPLRIPSVGRYSTQSIPTSLYWRERKV